MGTAAIDARRRGQIDGFNGKKKPRRGSFDYFMGYLDGEKMRADADAVKAEMSTPAPSSPPGGRGGRGDGR